MEPIKKFWTAIVSIVSGILLDAFKTKILSIIKLDPLDIPMSVLSFGLFGWGMFVIGTKWDSFFNKTSKLRWFLSKKIKQGEKLYKKKKYESLVTRRIPVDPPHILPGGEIMKEQMDYSQTEAFRHFYRVWIEQVFAGLKHGFGSGIVNEFRSGLPETALFNSMRDLRDDLINDLRYLTVKRYELKKDQLHPNFDPDCLKDYAEIKGL